MNGDQDLGRRRLAYRRAGYAVARCTQGRPLPDVTLEGPDPSRRAASRRWPVDLGSHGRHDLEMEILAQWLGLSSEARACLEGPEPPRGWGDLREPIAEMGRRVTRSEAENDAYLEWLRQRALGLLELGGVWAAVEAVAGALLEKGHVTEAQVFSMLAATRPSRRGGPLRFFFHEPK